MNIAEVEIFPRCINSEDNCDPDPEVTFVENITSTGCSYEIERIWTATDVCGNTSSQKQIIFVETTLDIDALALNNITCNGDFDGEAVVEISGGVEPITILWSNAQSTDTISNLSSGTYFVTVTDDQGCSTVDSIFLSEPPATTILTSLTSNFDGEAISCAGENNGSVRANATGGAGSFTYQWSNGDNSAIADSLTAGTYTVTATDIDGCTQTESITLNDPPILIATTAETNPISCFGENDGQATVTATGGIGTYSYQWSNRDTGPIVSSGNIANNLIAGTYDLSLIHI